jgi:putative transcriptional regulator
MKKATSNKSRRNAGKCSAAKIARSLRKTVRNVRQAAAERNKAAKVRVADVVETPHDWALLDATTAKEKHAAALGDPDAQPITKEREQRMRRTPQVSVIRRTLKLSQEEFSDRFAIPIGTLRDWEQGRKEPDTAARAFLVVIASIPEAVSDALARRRRALAKLEAAERPPSSVIATVASK